MKLFNGFKTIVMASIVMPMALMNVSAIAAKHESLDDIDKSFNDKIERARAFSAFLDKQSTYATNKRNQIFAGWTTLAGVSFAGKKAFESLAKNPVAASTDSCLRS